jgi:hypothetical protein
VRRASNFKKVPFFGSRFLFHLRLPASLEGPLAVPPAGQKMASILISMNSSVARARGLSRKGFSGSADC